MENFLIEKTQRTPEVNFNKSGVLLIRGRSIPENSIEFYNPIFDWLDGYIQSPAPSTEFNVKLEYFNTSSAKCLVEIFRKLEKLPQIGTPVKVNWFYEEEDEDMQYSGKDFIDIINLHIELVQISSDES
jgi:hypothetical protein